MYFLWTVATVTVIACERKVDAIAHRPSSVVKVKYNLLFEHAVYAV